MAEVASDEAKIAELRAIVQSIRDRVRAEYPETSVVLDAVAAEPIRVPLADLMPIVHARDAAQAKMAAVGSVNPRPSGLANDAIQFVKRSVSRGLGWFVRDQVAFNRGAMECVEATLEALNEMNRALASMAGSVGQSLQDARNAAEPRLSKAEADAEEARAAVSRLSNQMAELRGASEKSGSAAQRRIGDLEENTRALTSAIRGEFAQLTRAQHAEFEQSLGRAANEVQEKMGRDLQQARLEYERLIHSELRVIRQRGITAAPETAAAAHSGVELDYQAFSHRFRGSEEYVKANQAFYVERFRGLGEVLDIGCGQGEFLEVMREAGIPARGIDLSADSVANCTAKGLKAEKADLFEYLAGRTDHELDGVFISQVVEHLPGDRIPELIRLCARKLRHGGLLAMETPNPACLAIFATHFYLDPTHVRPVPAELLAFYMEENGLGGIDVQTRFPAVDSFPELKELPEGVRNRFFGGMDYAIFGRKL